MQFDGVKRAVQAVMGGGAAEQAGYAGATDRLTKARSAMADMDYKVKRASGQGIENESDTLTLDGLKRLIEQFGPNPDQGQNAVIAKRGSDFNSVATARGTMQENALQKIAIDAEMSGDPLSIGELNRSNAITNRGKTIIGSGVDPEGDSSLNQTRISAVTGAQNALADKRSAEAPQDGMPKRTTASEQRFMAFVPDEELSGYAAWKVDNKDNPELSNENAAIEQWRTMVDRGILNPATGQSIMGGDAPVMDGTSMQTAIPADSLTQAPAPGTWIIVDGNPQRYLGQRQ